MNARYNTAAEVRDVLYASQHADYQGSSLSILYHFFRRAVQVPMRKERLEMDGRIGKIGKALS